MKWRATVLAWGLAACAATSSDEPSGVVGISAPLPPSTIASSPDAWTLTWADDFDVDGELDLSKWIIWEGDRHHKTILNSSSREAVRQKDGALLVSAFPTPNDPNFKYTAGFISTEGTFAQTYGKVEFRLRGDYAPGLWYAVWGRVWSAPAVPEVDIEFLAENPTQVWFVNHWALPPLPADERRGFTTVNGFDITVWHTYTVTWTPALLEWLIDGKTYMRAEGRGVPHDPMFWTVNAWVGGWAGIPGASTKFPSHFELDYLRVYRPAEWLTDAQIRVVNPRDRVPIETTIDTAIADFDPGASVEVWDGTVRLVTMTKPPFKWKPTVPKGPHAFTFKATDGTRVASTKADVVIY